jgi:hypothetical protein
MDIAEFEFIEHLSREQRDKCAQAVMKLVLHFYEVTKNVYCDVSSDLRQITPYDFISIISANFLVQLLQISMPKEFSIAERLEGVEEFARTIADMVLHLWKVIETLEASEDSRN